MTEDRTGLCPRCDAALGMEREEVGLACQSCGGVFIRRDRVNAILAGSAMEGGAGPMSYRSNARTPSGAPHRLDLSEGVRYLRCPKCQSVMTRQNFARRSGILVDVCPIDGTWFDGGEIEAAAAFIHKNGPVDPKNMVPPISRGDRYRGDLLLDLFS